MTCKECKGRGSVALLMSIKPCAACNGTGNAFAGYVNSGAWTIDPSAPALFIQDIKITPGPTLTYDVNITYKREA